MEKEIELLTETEADLLMLMRQYQSGQYTHLAECIRRVRVVRANLRARGAKKLYVFFKLCGFGFTRISYDRNQFQLRLGIVMISNNPLCVGKLDD